MRVRTLAAVVVTAVLLTAASIPTGAAEEEQSPEKPVWDFGLGVGAISFADYRGADTTHVYVLPLPYLYYHGKFLKADRNGIRGKLFGQSWLELNISANATTPVRRNAARAGMPDLRSTIEIGPSLDMHLWKSADEKLRFDVRLPLRGVFTLQAPPHFAGAVFAPYASVDVKDIAGFQGWYLGALAGPLFGDHRYHDYFYTVAPQFATPERPAYEAHAGYSGAEILVSLSKRYPSFWMGAYVRHDTLTGAVFDSSPLVKRESYLAAGAGVAWIIHQSQQQVDETDD
ncbi:MAG: MipA/OmpV family protein [Sinobacteraceae bacterium]|nr:MipA/OmpV family protein [Nevskiaceae bacterium]